MPWGTRAIESTWRGFGNVPQQAIDIAVEVTALPYRVPRRSLVSGQAVEDALAWDPGADGGRDPDVEEAQLIRFVGIGADGDRPAGPLHMAEQLHVEVLPVRIAIDLEGRVELRRTLRDPCQSAVRPSRKFQIRPRGCASTWIVGFSSAAR